MDDCRAYVIFFRLIMGVILLVGSAACTISAFFCVREGQLLGLLICGGALFAAGWYWYESALATHLWEPRWPRHAWPAEDEDEEEAK
jgi:hypothetical protein